MLAEIVETDLCRSIYHKSLGNPEQKLGIVEFKISTAEWLPLQSPDVQVSSLENERENFRLRSISPLTQQNVEVEHMGLFTNR